MAVPPRSGVRTPRSMTRSIPASSLRAFSPSPRWSRSMTVHRSAATGFACRRDVGGRAVHRLEERVPVPQVSARKEAEPADMERGDIRKDVAEHVLDEDHVIAFGSPEDVETEGVDERVVGRHPLARRDPAGDLEEETVRCKHVRLWPIVEFRRPAAIPHATRAIGSVPTRVITRSVQARSASIRSRPE